MSEQHTHTKRGRRVATLALAALIGAGVGVGTYVGIAPSPAQAFNDSLPDGTTCYIPTPGHPQKAQQGQGGIPDKPVLT